MSDGDDTLSIFAFVSVAIVLGVLVGGFVLAIAAHWLVFMWKATAF